MFPLEWKLIAGALAALLLFGGVEWWKHDLKSEGAMECRAEIATGIAKTMQEADAKTETMKESAHELAKANALASSAIDARLAADIQRLRNRPASPANLPQAPGPAASDGHVGGLPIGDSDLLAIGARAARLQAKLAEYQAWAQTASCQVK